jgi:hypothetical protein
LIQKISVSRRSQISWAGVARTFAISVFTVSDAELVNIGALLLQSQRRITIV